MLWLLAIALVQSGNVPLGFAAGYASFMFVREIVAVRVIAEVRHNVRDS